MEPLDEAGVSRRAAKDTGVQMFHLAPSPPDAYGALPGRLIEEARRHGLPVHDSPELVALLMRLDLDQRIPPGLYRAIAELLLWAREIEIGQNARDQGRNRSS